DYFCCSYAGSYLTIF
nr:immunoglobulin light chain junction region [Macaca mulatta]MOW17639.1 immunoglobulin light chain junction region [Macaca mulatta]